MAGGTGPSGGRPFVVLEGVEGAGKTTQARLLALWLEEEGIPFTLAREPGGTEVGEAIRGIVLDRDGLSMPPETELFLILAARAAFVRQVVRPALSRGEVVVADRFDFSTFAYQGYGRGLDLGQVRAANAVATGGLKPDLYVVLDLPVPDGMARKDSGSGPDRIEQEGEPFLERVADGYRALSAEEGCARTVQAQGSLEEVQGRIRRLLQREFPETFPSPRV
jgi:dTMP kinase